MTNIERDVAAEKAFADFHNALREFTAMIRAEQQLQVQVQTAQVQIAQQQERVEH